jgi:hypothetical protein
MFSAHYFSPRKIEHHFRQPQFSADESFFFRWPVRGFSNLYFRTGIPQAHCEAVRARPATME